MRALLAFLKKEWTGQLRGVRVIILCAISLLLAVMNIAVAKMTPMLLEMMSDMMAESGMVIEILPVSALDSWVQFFKNIPMLLIAFVFMESDIFTREYTSGTLVLALTKGLRRSNVVIAKSTLLITLWSVCFWLNYAVTYFGNTLFWDNSVAQHLPFAALCYWIFGLWIIALCVLFSTLGRSYIVVLLGIGAPVFLCSILSMFPKVNEVIPYMISDGTSLVYGMKSPEDYVTALIITAVMIVGCFAASIPLMNKKQL